MSNHLCAIILEIMFQLYVLYLNILEIDVANVLSVQFPTLNVKYPILAVI